MSLLTSADTVHGRRVRSKFGVISPPPLKERVKIDAVTLALPSENEAPQVSGIGRRRDSLWPTEEQSKAQTQARADFKIIIFQMKLLLLAIMAQQVHRKNETMRRPARGTAGLLQPTMLNQLQPVLGEPAEWLGDWHPLVEQLGSANGLAALSEVSAAMQIPQVHDLPSLRRFLHDYQQQFLLPVELPAIQRAFDHTCRHEVRELVEFDRQLAEDSTVRPFAEASRRVGQCELQKLRPLRDERIVRRYLEAVEHGEANAWHTLVYGLTLALYSLPLRQGLLGYGFQTTRGFIYSAAKSLELSEKDCRGLLEELCANLPASVETVIAQRAAA
jgi:urease accessory protein UreF